MKKVLYLLIFCWITNPVLVSGQDLYMVQFSSSGLVFGQYNLNTCTFCSEFVVPPSALTASINGIAALPNGNVVAISTTGRILTFDPPNPVPLSVFISPPGTFFTGITLAPNGNIYITGYETVGSSIFTNIYQYNPVTNTVSVVGSLPAGFVIYSFPFFWNGQLYAYEFDFSSIPQVFSLVTLQLGNPIVATTVNTVSVICSGGVATIPSGPNAGIYGGVFDQNCSGTDLYNFDINNNSAELECAVNASLAYGISGIPPGFPPPPAACSCVTTASALTTAGGNLCVNAPFDFEVSGGFLEPDDVEQYILFSNLNNITGSIIATSNNTEFSFDPATMQTGVTYYVAAIAGNNAGGNVNLSDVCLDISPSVSIVWRPTPTVAFATSNPSICDGACTTVNVSFTGSAPFELTYSSPVSGAATLVFGGNSGSFEVCAPVGASAGSFVLQTTVLSDLFCSCP